MTDDDGLARGYARQVLGAALVSRDGLDALQRLTADDFPWSVERLLSETIRSMYLAGDPVDAVTVAAELRERGTLARVGGAVSVHGLVRDLVTAANVSWHAGLLRAETRRRMASEVAERSHRQLLGLDADAGESPEVVWDLRSAAEALIPPPLDDDGIDRSLAAFMDSEESETKWIIPGLLARGERVVVTGGEGLGKGVLLRQMAASVASGWHPFGGGPFAPARVLYVDLENPRPAIKETFYQCHRALGWDYSRVEMRYEPDGVDLLGAGTAWLHQVVGDYAPDLLVIGPAYKTLGDADEREGVVISRLLRRLDQVRRRHDVALLIEQHTPHEAQGQQRTVRPVGSSMWRRWADIGVGIRPHDLSAEDEAERAAASVAERATWMDVIRWKPPRGQRDWPRQIRYGERNQLPWVPAGHYEIRSRVHRGEGTFA